MDILIHVGRDMPTEARFGLHVVFVDITGVPCRPSPPSDLVSGAVGRLGSERRRRRRTVTDNTAVEEAPSHIKRGADVGVRVQFPLGPTLGRAHGRPVCGSASSGGATVVYRLGVLSRHVLDKDISLKGSPLPQQKQQK